MITDAELTALYGNGLRPDTAARLIDDLRAARAERDALASKAARIFERSAEPDPLLDENRDLRARLAAAEAERASTEHAWNNALYDVLAEKTRATATEARLAAVRDLCDEARENSKDDPAHDPLVREQDVRAVIDQEADRG